MGLIVVTGGHGYLGSHLVKRLRQLGETVRVFARRQLEDDATDGHLLVRGDIRDAAAVDAAIAEAEVVIHLVSNFRSARTDAGEAYAINVTGTDNVLKAAERHRIDQLIHCSTIGVHGDVREVPANEESPFNPGDRYQETKLIAEDRARQAHAQGKVPVTVVRPISIFGPGDRRLLKLFRMIQHKRFILFGSGEAFFQPAYIDDVVDGFIACLRNPRAIGGVFIIGGQEYVPLNEFVRLIADELGVAPPRLHLPYAPALVAAAICEKLCAPFGIEPPLHRRRMSFFVNNRAFSVDHAKAVLGYRPQTTLREGIQRTAEWYRQQGWL